MIWWQILKQSMSRVSCHDHARASLLVADPEAIYVSRLMSGPCKGFTLALQRMAILTH